MRYCFAHLWRGFVGTMCLLTMTLLFSNPSFAKLDNKVNENEKQYGKSINETQFSDKKNDFAGKIYYDFPLHGWQIVALYRDGKVISETVRPRGFKVKKEMISEREANAIGDIVYPRKERGPYRKQINNANFISHFFDKGVISFEMQLDKRRKKHLGVIGVRAILYSDDAVFKNIKVNAYH